MSENTEIIKRTETIPGKSNELLSVVPVVDIYENEDEILLYADMPGVSRKDLTVNIDNGKLMLSGVRTLETSGVTNWEEFSSVMFNRIFSVPQTIDIEKVNAELKEGVLRLHLPKSEAAKPKLIKINEA